MHRATKTSYDHEAVTRFTLVVRTLDKGMDARRCYFPNYRMGDQPSPSHWPLSHIRSSVRSQDDSSDLDTFKVNWVGDQRIPLAYPEGTIRNLTGRSLQESFARLKRKRSWEAPCPGSPSPPAAPPHKPEARMTSDPEYPFSKKCSSSDESAGTSRLDDQDMAAAAETNATDGIKETKQAPTPLSGSHACPQCDMTFARDSDLRRHTQEHEVEIQDCTNAEASTIAMSIEDVSLSSARSLSIQREQTPQSPHKTTIVSQLLSQIHIKPQDSSANQQVSLSQSPAAPPLLPREQSEDDDDAMKVDESSPPPKVKKPKQKSNQQGSPFKCELCDTTCKRHFDLLRHNQIHQVEKEEDMSRRTCTNCDRVLSRVDATKRHVDTIPESCNYLYRKLGLKPLLAKPAEQYDACREQYYKLAQERKKPKGRKKANPAL